MFNFFIFNLHLSILFMVLLIKTRFCAQKKYHKEGEEWKKKRVEKHKRKFYIVFANPGEPKM